MILSRRDYKELEVGLLFYHCSSVARIKDLEPNTPNYFDKPRLVSMTTLLPMALFYGISHFEYTYGYNREKKLYYMEHFPDALEKLYSGKKAFLYQCEDKDNYEKTMIPNEFVSRSSVHVIGVVVIEDLYEEILKQEKLGNLIIIRYQDLNNENREWIKNAETEVILKKGLLDQKSAFSEYMRMTYPDSWILAETRTKCAK